MSEIIVEVTDVSKTYKRKKLEVPALKNVNLQVSTGEVVSIMGTSGSGKTTLLNMIGGLDSPTTGRVAVGGVDITRLSEPQLADFRLSKIGFVFQFYNLFPMLTAFENVEYPLVLAKKPKDEREKRVWTLLESVAMQGRANHKPDELSGGEQQRVGIARALANNPAIVLADEPTGDLDSENAAAFMKTVKRLNEANNKTFLIVTHDPIVSKQCNKTYFIRDGKIQQSAHGEKMEEEQ
jgi:putative ABC transport system ATP-binding protein